MKMAAELYKRLKNGKPVVASGKWLVAGHPWSIVHRLFLLTIIGFWLTAFSLHPYYMSVTEFEYKPAEKEVQVACKIFTDDLEEALKKEYKRKVDILNTSAKKENEQLLNRYLQQHLRLQLDGKTLLCK
jgi:RecG-like helicase